MKMRNILSLISIAFLGAMLAGGCKTTPQPNVPEAKAYIQKTYPGTNVVKMERTGTGMFLSTRNQRDRSVPS